MLKEKRNVDQAGANDFTLCMVKVVARPTRGRFFCSNVCEGNLILPVKGPGRSSLTHSSRHISISQYRNISISQYLCTRPELSKLCIYHIWGVGNPWQKRGSVGPTTMIGVETTHGNTEAEGPTLDDWVGNHLGTPLVCLSSLALLIG
ncbi:hypothetical protein SLA2020_435770 [Shorea laevis]